jgi:beta-N-acetylhexosaminidase
MVSRTVITLVGVATITAACGSTANIAAVRNESTTAAPTIAPASSGAAEPSTLASTTTSAPAPSTTTLAPSTTVAPPVAPGICTALTDRELVAQLVMPGVTGPQVNGTTSKNLVALGVGGVIVMTAPANGRQVVAMKESGALPLLVAVDEEGGTVQRLKTLGRLPSARQQAKRTPDEVEQLITDHATKIRSWGFDVAFGPVVDVAPTKGKGPFDDRTFSTFPDTVSAYGAATVRGWQQGAVLPVIKHFPGHGAASGDTHKVSAATAPLADLEARDLIPFEALGGTGTGVMMSHLTTPGLSTDDLPASLDPAMYAYLRSHGHAGALVFTDALEMQPVARIANVAEAAELAIIAGADVALTSQAKPAQAMIDQLEDALASGRLTQERARDAASRVLAVKGLTLCPKQP